MYCPVCGDQSTQGLNYCKRCGANLLTQSGGLREDYSSRPMSLMLPVAAVSITGLIALFVTIYNLGMRGIDGRTLVGITVFGGATVVAVVWAVMWLLLRIIGDRHTLRVDPRFRTPNQLAPPEQQRVLLVQPGVGVPSVTENTTRSFDQFAARERNTQ